MASTRSIRKLHQQQMAVTIAVRKVMKYWGEGSVTFACMDDAVAYLRGITAEIESSALPHWSMGAAEVRPLNEFAPLLQGEVIIPKALA